MREIKFRGKKIDNNECVYGGYFNSCEEEGLVNYIFDNINGAEPCQINSIGQFTGLKDKNGVEIYEGDIVRFRGGRKPKNEQRPFVLSTVIFKDTMFTVEENSSIFTDSAILKFCEVIGNIYENPELL